MADDANEKSPALGGARGLDGDDVERCCQCCMRRSRDALRLIEAINSAVKSGYTVTLDWK